MFHNHAYKGVGFYAFATNLTYLAYLVGRLDLTRFSFYFFSLCIYYIKNFLNFQLNIVTSFEYSKSTFRACADKSSLDSASISLRDHSGRCDRLLILFYLVPGMGIEPI